MRRAETLMKKQTIETWTPPRQQSVSEWAEENRVLLRQSSAEAGAWRNERTPYLTEIQDEFGNRDVERIVLQKGSQLGGTEAILNCLAFAIAADPAPILIVYPTLDLARSTSGSRIQPMIDASPALSSLKPANADEFSLQEMHFPGCNVYLSGANSAASLASRPCRYVFLDEVDKFPVFAGKEADPISLAEERQKTFWNRKTVIISTPTLDTGTICREIERCDEVRDYHVACPHCGAGQQLVFPQIKWPADLDKQASDYPLRVRDSAWYECEHCGGRVEKIHRSAMLRSGKWQARKKAKHPKSIGFVISSLYSPWLSWGDVAEAFIRAKDYPEKLMNFINSWLAEPFVARVGKPEERAAVIASCRTSLPLRQLPEEAQFVTVGIDVQKAGFWFLVRAWTQDSTSWMIDYGYLTEWQQIENLLWDTEYIAESGRKLRPWRALIDTAGSEREASTQSSTEEAYQWLRKQYRRPGCSVWGAKGSSGGLPGNVKLGIPLDRTPSGKPFGLQIVTIDTDKAKSALWWRYERAVDREPSAAYIASDSGPDYQKQILAEEQRLRRDGSIDWQLVRGRDNHLLDCECLAWACTDDALAGGLRFARQTAAPLSTPAQPPQPKQPNPYTAGRTDGGVNPYTRR
jgi:phage terminase large subunit GpA-like protein